MPQKQPPARIAFSVTIVCVLLIVGFIVMLLDRAGAVAEAGLVLGRERDPRTHFALFQK
jgi:hypothetical protein